jgi:NHL repeat
VNGTECGARRLSAGEPASEGWDLEFESGLLQRRVRCEPDFLSLAPPRVHKYTPDGKLLMSWGEPGTGEGEFNIVHNICCDADGWVYVADRENHRVQVFDGNGKFETQWQNLHRPCGLCMPYGHQPIFYVGRSRSCRCRKPRHPQPWAAG